MDITTLRILATLASFGAFLGIAWWACARANRGRFDEAARIPFAEDLQ
jgi:cytochrome c oxidase cbb3-type subunit 4